MRDETDSLVAALRRDLLEVFDRHAAMWESRAAELEARKATLGKQIDAWKRILDKERFNAMRQ